MRLVDGGYFDNEGTAAIYGLLASLNYARERPLCPSGVRSTFDNLCRAKPFQVYLLQISSSPEAGTESHIYGSFATPIAGITSIRGAWKQRMSDVLINDIYASWGRLPCGRPRASIFLDTTMFRPFDPDQGMFYLPLSWQL
ncbi:hypothetical protein, partial [Mesorhizobium sp. M1A.F.Ca.IN.020.32.1.1]|uniref:hypothetical protein n=1 Tax=Mesorhizobium sp. M1A.F.Ca.IN.020.32.1.1 TaxID=2496763 RepID=UPI0019D415A4